MSIDKSAFLIAAPKSNSGKTIITLGIIHALVKRGLLVQPFKCGPDYIDTMHHSLIAGKASYNLDLWMAEEAHVQNVFSRQAAKADVSLVEGVMGLFDGAKKDVGSSAAVARLLDLPVILVVDASSVAYSVAPLLYGFKNFDQNINLAGVIFNKVAGESHFQFLKEAADDAGVDVLGYVPRDERLAIESRHLGLHLPGESKNTEIVKLAAELIEKHVDIDLLLKCSERKAKYEVSEVDERKSQMTIALAFDQAFNFSYKANMDAMEAVAEIIEFSPLDDTTLPDADLVWLPGGYPELYADRLAKNVAMKNAIKKHVEQGKALIAECGGMMYLGKKLITKDGQEYPMAGVFDYDTSFTAMKLHLGYRVLINHSYTLRGHEFHYSELYSHEKGSAAFEVKTARGRNIEMPVFRKQNCWASYMHLYLGEKEKMMQLFKELSL
jgi:cobyrinic acid a,c-diamide synthase